MPKLTYDAMVIERGLWSFDDGRSIHWVRLADGETMIQATLPDGVDPNVIPVLEKGIAEVEVYSNQAGKLKARLVGFDSYGGKG